MYYKYLLPAYGFLCILLLESLKNKMFNFGEAQFINFLLKKIVSA